MFWKQDLVDYHDTKYAMLTYCAAILYEYSIQST